MNLAPFQPFSVKQVAIKSLSELESTILDVMKTKIKMPGTAIFDI